jgi:hypothetical protein
MSPEIICDAVITKFPGKLLINDNYIVLQKPFSNDYSLDVYNINTGEKIGKTLKVGDGPGEFPSPNIAYIYSDSIFVYDYHKKDYAARFSIVSALKESYDYRMIPDKSCEGITRMIKFDRETDIALKPQAENIFEFKGYDEEFQFGHTPLDLKINNGHKVFQGDISYNPDKKLMVYTNIYFPYVSIFKYEKNTFSKVFETNEIQNSKVVNGQLQLRKDKKGISSSVVTKDYIVCCQRDYEYDDTDESTVGRDFSKVSSTVFLYDYDGDLLEIIDLGYPVIRIAAKPDNNELYAVVLNNEFQIVKYYSCFHYCIFM